MKNKKGLTLKKLKRSFKELKKQNGSPEYITVPVSVIEYLLAKYLDGD